MPNEQTAERPKQDRERAKHYTIADSLLIQRNRTLHKHFKNNLAAFTAFDPDFDPMWELAWNTLIDNTEAMATDGSMDAELKACSHAVREAIEECMDKANDLHFWVKKAFPKKPAVLREFGLTERAKARTKSLNTVVWMLVMKAMAENVYSAELAAVNMPAGLPAEIQAAADALGEKEITQEFQKRMNLRQTRLRIEQLNELHARVSTVHKAAQSVFKNDKERRDLFNLS